MPSATKALPKKFGETVRRLRVEAGLSQIALAEKADLTHNYVGEIERGEKLASLETIVRLASGFGLKGAELMAKAKI
ncbi:MAG TPA: helix-turn-helix transcriptional regulator [Opitutaceae bacterium]|nr:helix-turn-helix transcriptional regulator [Opitutaceae bacterium]